jgi:hypothetical protein
MRLHCTGIIHGCVGYVVFFIDSNIELQLPKNAEHGPCSRCTVQLGAGCGGMEVASVAESWAEKPNPALRGYEHQNNRFAANRHHDSTSMHSSRAVSDLLC